MKKESPKNSLSKYARFSSIAVQMGGTIYLGSLLGGWLDQKYANQNQLYTKICTILAVIVAIYNVIKQVSVISKDK